MKNLRIEFKWAIIFFFTALVWVAIEKLVGLHDVYINKHPVYTNGFAVLAIIIFILALLDKRKNYYKGVMTYKQGFATGLVMSLIITMLTPLSQYITSTIISPDYFTNAISYSVAEGLMTQEEAENYFSLNNYIVQSLIAAPILGLLTTSIVALFIRKKAK